jgi:hypothetical protein
VAELPTITPVLHVYVNDSGGGSQGNTMYGANDNGAAPQDFPLASFGGNAPFNILNPFIVKLRIQRIY